MNDLSNPLLINQQYQNNFSCSITRTFSVGDLVEYKPYETCTKQNISGVGQISQILGDGYYRVMFGDYERKVQWWSNGKYHWSNLWPYKDNLTKK